NQEFMVGLQCDTYIQKWVCVVSSMTFKPFPGMFESEQFDPENCSSLQKDSTFLLTSRGTLKALEEYNVGFIPSLAVCQRRAVDDSWSDSPTTGPPTDYSGLIIGLTITIAVLVIVLIVMLIRYRKQIANLMS
ncbi:hypothetical protein PMAYCL1PPCAC_22825, partial [Pristionchus mayeri]